MVGRYRCILVWNERWGIAWFRGRSQLGTQNSTLVHNRRRITRHAHRRGCLGNHGVGRHSCIARCGRSQRIVFWLTPIALAPFPATSTRQQPGHSICLFRLRRLGPSKILVAGRHWDFDCPSAVDCRHRPTLVSPSRSVVTKLNPVFEYFCNADGH